MTDFNEICVKLDELVIQYFNILDDLNAERTLLENSLKQGYFNLSKARYSMGNKSVGSLQYNSKCMKALAEVCINETSEECFELIRKKPEKKTSKSKTVQQIESTTKQTTVRRRKGQEEKSDGDSESTCRIEELTITDKSTENEGDVEVLTDPIKWFGILVPGVLRHGQADFIQAVSTSCRIANLQKELITTKAEYRSLYSKKQQLNTENINTITAQ
ncbi:coiled-coil domain-containing protein 115-like [Antedon mediterranea]|uniref:coiled-coil domain-containing protein 115-like n=1 Tax=Antedon mediterranea TaxID=105859 RepID=UPI003AF81FE6